MGRMLRAFREDRAMRDAARRLVENDWRRIVGGVGERGLGQRLLDRAEEGALDIAEDASAYAEDHPAKVAAGAAVAFAAALGWFFRGAIADKLQHWWDWDESGTESRDEETAERPPER